MLKTTKSTTIQGTSNIATETGEVVVVSMTATITEDGRIAKNETIINQEVYDAHKKECRVDIDAFTSYVRDVEDAE